MEGEANPATFGNGSRCFIHDLPNDVHTGSFVRKREAQFIAFGQPESVGGGENDFLANAGSRVCGLPSRGRHRGVGRLVRPGHSPFGEIAIRTASPGSRVGAQERFYMIQAEPLMQELAEDMPSLLHQFASRGVFDERRDASLFEMKARSEVLRLDLALQRTGHRYCFPAGFGSKCLVAARRQAFCKECYYFAGARRAGKRQSFGEFHRN